MAIRPTLLDGAECWTSKKNHIKKMGVTEMHMLRWICRNIFRDKIRNENIWRKVEVADVIKQGRIDCIGLDM